MDKTWTQDLLDFLDRSPTCYHAVAELAVKLTAAGYRPLEEHEPWTLTPGQGYFVVRGQASLAAFRVPEGPWRGFAIAAAHSDSPTFKIREEAEVSGAGKTVRLSVEPYGGGHLPLLAGTGRCLWRAGCWCGRRQVWSRGW